MGLPQPFLPPPQLTAGPRDTFTSTLPATSASDSCATCALRLPQPFLTPQQQTAVLYVHWDYLNPSCQLSNLQLSHRCDLARGMQQCQPFLPPHKLAGAPHVLSGGREQVHNRPYKSRLCKALIIAKSRRKPQEGCDYLNPACHLSN